MKFVLFGNDTRPQLKLEFPTMDQIEITKKRWQKSVRSYLEKKKFLCRTV